MTPEQNQLLENWEERAKAILITWLALQNARDDKVFDYSKPIALIKAIKEAQVAKARAESNYRAFEILGEKALKTKSIEALDLIEEAQQQILDDNNKQND